MQLIDAYTNYFKHQAAAHPDLLEVDGGAKIFEVISIEDAFGDFRGAVVEKSFILRLILPSYSLGDNYAANGLKGATGGFIIAKNHSNRVSDKQNWLETMRDAERVGFEIIEKMIADSKKGHPLFNYSINTADKLNLEVQPKIATGDSGYSGWLFIFSFANFFRNCPGTVAWLDGGTTPKA